ncbi:Reticuline oxidase-like protein [Glycine soja]|uniref:Reticuline oxidase-like protein n=1 Tax=Glycine soja TaxID=3848 RepID=A0A0B2PIF8_GLYSO|nr:Reticuline oxidase-like protein [Glycine soja]
MPLSFNSTLNLHVHNKRFKTQTSPKPLAIITAQGFLNYRDLDIGAKHPSNSTNFVQSVIYASKLFKESLERLVIVKITVDPSNFFSYEQSIPTDN